MTYTEGLAIAKKGNLVNEYSFVFMAVVSDYDGAFTAEELEDIAVKTSLHDLDLI